MGYEEEKIEKIKSYTAIFQPTQPTSNSHNHISTRTTNITAKTYTSTTTKPQTKFRTMPNPHIPQPLPTPSNPHLPKDCSVVYGFIIRKPQKSHCITFSLYINIFIYLFILNIKYMINSLITLVFFKNNNNNNSLIILASVDWESQTKSKEKLDQ